MFLRIFKNADNFAARRGLCNLGGLGNGFNGNFGGDNLERNFNRADDYRNNFHNNRRGFAEFEKRVSE